MGCTKKEQIVALEEEEPETFEEMLLKKRWSSLCKDPERGMKTEKAKTNIAPWPIMNHLSPK